jgi:hypothetical protein
MPIYDQTLAHSFLRMRDRRNGKDPNDPDQMAARFIEGVDIESAPLLLVFGSPALEDSLKTLGKWIAGFQAQIELAASTDTRARHDLNGTLLPNTTTCRGK